MSKKNKKKSAKATAKPKNGAPDLSVVIPAYNEQKLIRSTVSEVTEYLDSRSLDYEIIVVDDGSSDTTVAIVQKLSKKNPRLRVVENGRNRGKGFSVKNGMLNARGRRVCFSDADLSTPIDEIEKLLHWIDEGYDVAIGSRALAESEIEIHQPQWRELMGKGFNLLVRILAVRGINDTQCGFKCFTAEAASVIFSKQRVEGFGFDVELLFIADREGYKIKEVPVKWLNRFESRVNPIFHPIQMLYDIIKLRLRAIMGGYR